MKLGGHAIDDVGPGSPVLSDLASDLGDLDGPVAVVHGGGPQIAGLLHRLGLESRFVEGLRVTDPPTMDVVAMALGWVNVGIVAALQHRGLDAVGVTGPDGGIVRGVVAGGELGRVALVPQIDAGLIRDLWAADRVPVVSSIGLAPDGGLVNCNADSVAGALAAALGADQLILLSDVDQIRQDPDDPSTAIERVSAAELEAMLESGAVRDGMRPKARAALDALAGGARRVIVASGTRRYALSGVVARTVPVTEVVA